MRLLNAVLVLGATALVLPATAEAKGGKALEGLFKRGGGGGPSAPVRAAPIRSPVFRPSTSVPSPRASSPAPSFTRTVRRAAAPISGGRVRIPRVADHSGGQDVHSRGQGVASGFESRRTVRLPRVVSGKPVSDHAAAIRGNPDARIVSPTERLRTRPDRASGPGDDGGAASGGNRDRVPGFIRRGGRGSPGAPGDGIAAGATYGTSGTTTGTRWSGAPTYYGSGWRSGYRVGYRDGWHDTGHFHGWGYHDWYDHNHFFLSFTFGSAWGPYYGVSYYHPFHSWTLGIDYAFFYPAPVSYCYVPFGFYSVYEPVYVTRYTTVVRETVPTYVYETRVTRTVEEIEGDEESGAKGPADVPEAGGEVKTADPRPAAGSPATEKLLREASDLFRKKEYYDAAVKFRLAAISSPDLPGPLFALGQSLIAMGQDAYAARVLRKAVIANPALLEETADLVGVYEGQAEFDRVMADLEERAAAAPADGDARFLLGYQRYFTGDPRCREAFDGLHEAAPKDEAVNLFRTAVEKRFRAPADLPPIEKR